MMKALFYPDVLFRKGKSLTQHLCEKAGYDVTRDIDSDWDICFYWNFASKNIIPNELINERRLVINRYCNNVLKDKLDIVFKNVFGYSSEADTNRYGHCVKKSIEQCAKNFAVVETPCENEKGYIYQKFINSRIAIDTVRDFRIYKVFDKWVVATRDKHISGTFAPGDAPVKVTFRNDYKRYFIKNEVDKINEVCKRMGLDVGAVDVVRDYSDGKLYVIDINNIPGISKRDTPEVIDAVYKLFKSEVENQYAKY